MAEFTTSDPGKRSSCWRASWEQGAEAAVVSNPEYLNAMLEKVREELGPDESGSRPSKRRFLLKAIRSSNGHCGRDLVDPA